MTTRQGTTVQVLSQQPMLFREFEELRSLLRSEVCPLILKTLRYVKPLLHR